MMDGGREREMNRIFRLLGRSVSFEWGDSDFDIQKSRFTEMGQKADLKLRESSVSPCPAVSQQHSSTF